MKPMAVVRTFFFRPIEKILAQIDGAFQKGNSIVEVKGFPIKVFCFSNPDHIKTILTHPDVGQTKCPVTLMRVKYVMRTGGYIQKGGTPWKTRRQQVQEAFNLQSRQHAVRFIPELTKKFISDWLKSSESIKNQNILPFLHSLITKINFKMFFSEDLKNSDLPEIVTQTQFIETNFVRPIPLWVPTSKNRTFRKHTKHLRNTFHILINKTSA